MLAQWVVNIPELSTPKEKSKMIRIHRASAEEKKLVSEMFDAVFSFFKIDQHTDVDLTFVGEKVIRELNRDYRGVDRVTDVLSFPNVDVKVPYDIKNYPYDLENGALQLGELMICRKRMKEQALEYGHSETRELCFLTVHGLLHLLGFDHIKKSDEKVMFGLQEEILNTVGITR